MEEVGKEGKVREGKGRVYYCRDCHLALVLLSQLLHEFAG